jgi:hypothetical protein
MLGFNIGPSMFNELRRQMDAAPHNFLNAVLLGLRNSFLGIPIQSSNVFPFSQSCSSCAGTGQGGDEATYCPNCKGAGEVVIEGVVNNSKQITLVVSHKPPRFQPTFPFALPLRKLERY